MDQLFDSLSEDWISQPRSNESVPDSPSPSFARSTASHQSRASQSRIPRVANSTPLTPSAGASRRSQSVLSGKSLAKRNEPLKEVTASHINASINKKPPEQRSPAKQQEKVGAKPAQKALTSKIPQGTVQRNLESVTASKSNRPLGTPDWKRRLRKDIASGQAQDLFSANGLEGIFKPPVGSPTGSISKKKVSVPTNDFRSSPPPYPPPVTNRKVQSDNVQKPSTSLIRKPSQDCGHRRPSSAAGPHHERSRQTSGGTDELNENISPYYVSRHNTVDGHVDYAPIDLSMSQIRAQINRVRQQQQHLVSSVATESASDGRETRQEPMTETPNSDWQNQSLPDDLSTGTAAFTLNGGFVTMRRGGASNESSFMRRSLSPSSERRVSRTGLRRSLSVGATPKDPTNAAEIPSTPQGFTRIGSYQLNAEGKPSSPLKLFDHHDTFTNNRLLRHLGTFDDESVRGAHTQLVQASKRRGTDVDQHRIRHSCDQSFGGTQLHGHDFDCSALSSELSSVRLPTRNRQDLSSFPRESRSGEVSVSSTTFSAGKAVEFTTQGKRLPYSPHKVPRRKRRRTLLQESSGRPPLTSESSIGVSGSASRLPPQSVVGKKRKDALHGKRSEAADPDVLALRQILRPRTLTQSKSLPQDENRHPRSSTPSMSVNDIKIRDGPAKPLLAGELTNIAVDMVKHIVAADNSRKPSVTTADFHREAQQVMQLLRMQGRPLGGLPEQDSERDQACERSSPVYDRESTRDDFSRPPSREGSKPRGRSDHALINQRVVSQLQRFQEDDEPGLVLSSSLKSLKLTTGTSEERAKVVETRPSNPSDFTEDEAHNVNSIDSKASSDPSTQRSIPTNSSQSSKGKAVIPPDAVAHLLSAEVAGMTFDHANQRWVRSRSPERSRKSGLSPQPDSILTEEDVFARISDLSTEANDGHQPLGHSQGSGRESNKDLRNAISRHDCANDYCPRPGLSTRPHTADGARSETLEASSAPSRFSQWASSGPPPETRATSWGDEAFTGKIGHPISDHQAADQTPDAESEEEVEHEISILDGRESKKAIESKRVGHQQPRVVTVSFSSPLETHHEEIDAGDESATNMSRYPHPCRMASVGNRRRRASFTKRRSSSHGKAYIRSAQDYNDLFPRPMSRLDEREEDSVNGHNSQIYNGDMQVAISTPLAQHRITPSQLTLGGPVSSIGFQLTPLSAFTTHPHDSSLDVEGDYLARRVGKDVARKGSLATQELVKKLQDAQPDEPYWDYLPDLVLQDQKLSTLHMLDEFCCSLVRLDVSNNALSEVNGAPPSVRYLNATNNMISDLAPWAHLRNLQYLDVSGNQLTTLQGFRALVHLRELKADNNRIESLDGIEMLDGLIYFSLCNNLVGKVDFDGFELYADHFHLAKRC